MKNNNRLYAFLKSNLFVFTSYCFVVLLFSSSCQKDPVPSAFSQGVFIVNEGSFGNLPGGISWVGKNDAKISHEDLFQSVNQSSLGDVVQSMYVYNDKGYIVDNNAKKVEVVAMGDFKSSASINGFAMPRYVLAVNNTTAYVTQWGADGVTGSIQIVNLNTNKITANIPTPAGAEQMTKINDFVYVTCNGGYGSENKIVVINTTTNTVTETITVGDNPSFIQQDKNGQIWVLCQGKMKDDYSGLATAGQLVRINPATNFVVQTLTFPQDQQPQFLECNMAKDELYYQYKTNIYALPISATTLNTNTAFIQRTKAFYGINVDPKTGDLYAGYAPNFTAYGFVFRYQKDGTLVGSFQSGGIAPRQFLFY